MLKGVAGASGVLAVESCHGRLALRITASPPSGGTETVRLNSPGAVDDEPLLPLLSSSAGSDIPLACAYLHGHPLYWIVQICQLRYPSMLRSIWNTICCL